MVHVHFSTLSQFLCWPWPCLAAGLFHLQGWYHFTLKAGSGSLNSFHV